MTPPDRVVVFFANGEADYYPPMIGERWNVLDQLAKREAEVGAKFTFMQRLPSYRDSPPETKQ